MASAQGKPGGENCPFSLFNTYAALRDDDVVTSVDIPEPLQGTPAGNDHLSNGWPAGAIHIASGWEEWQRHPSGDALLFLLRGALEIVMRDALGGEERRVAMKAGGALIVPSRRVVSRHSCRGGKPASARARARIGTRGAVVGC